MSFLRYIPGWPIVLLFLCPPVFSQIRDTLDLEEVVVTGELKPVLRDRSLYQIKSISAREIRGRAATNLSELLATELSFRVSQDAALGASLRLNGLSGEHVKILVDGVPLVGRQERNIDLNQVNLFKVDHIEVVEGPMSVIYGSNALGGVINIITQRPVYGKRNSYKLRSYYETAGVYNFDADVVVARNKNIFNLNGGRHFFDGYSAPSDQFRYQTWKPKLQWNGNFDYSLRTKKLNLNIGSSLFLEELRNKENPGDNPERAKDEYHFTARSLNKIDLTAPISGKINTTALFYYSYYRKLKNTVVKDLVTLEEFPLDNASAQDTTVFDNITGRWMLGGTLNDKLDFQSGLEYSIEKGTGKRVKGEKSISETAGFASFKYKVLKLLDIQSGFRLLHNSQFNAPLIFNFNTLWEINPKSKIRFSYGKGFRAPSLKELYLEFIDVNHHVQGNDSLKPESSAYTGLSGDFVLNNHFSLNANLFQNAVKEKIDLFYNSTDASKAQYNNLTGKTFIRGAKLHLNYNRDSRLRIQAGAQLNGQSKFQSDSYSWSTDASLSASYNFQKLKSKLSFFYKYNGKFVFYTANFDEIGSLQKVNENFLDKYHSLDFIVTKWLWDEKAEISAGIKNAFNNTNILGRGSTGPHSGGGVNDNPVGWGRSFFVQLQFNLNYDRKISTE